MTNIYLPDHVHAQIVQRLTALLPEPFASRLDSRDVAAFLAEHAGIVPASIARFEAVDHFEQANPLPAGGDRWAAMVPARKSDITVS